MNKPIKSLILATLLAFSGIASAQTNDVGTLTNSSLLGGTASGIISFLASSTNLMVAPYGIASTDGKYGAGIALAYKLSDMLVPTMRLDYFDGRVWMPSADMQLQAPLVIAGKFTVIPFGFAGIATPLTGKGNANFSAVGMVGLGAAIRIGSRWDLVGDIEKWSGFKGEQIRGGVAYKLWKQ